MQSKAEANFRYQNTQCRTFLFINVRSANQNFTKFERRAGTGFQYELVMSGSAASILCKPVRDVASR
jgi:hypothetical protein